jgi:hypothetical protein
MKSIKTKSKNKVTTTTQKLNMLLEKLPSSKAQELLDFGDFLMSRLPTPRKTQKLGDRFAGVWKDARSVEEIIADIRNSRVNGVTREEL